MYFAIIGRNVISNANRYRYIIMILISVIFSANIAIHYNIITKHFAAVFDVPKV